MSTPSCMVTGMTERTDANGTDFYRPLEAAQQLGVTMKTMTRYAERGLVLSRVLPSGHRRYLKSDVDALRERSAS